MRITVISLFCVSVRPILEFGAVVRNPHTADDSRQLESVQRRFLRFASHLLHISCEPHDYSKVADMLNLVNLAERKCSAGITFVLWSPER